MKRKIRRLRKKKLVAYLASLGVIFPSIALTYTVLKDAIISMITPTVTEYLKLDENDTLTLPIINSIFLVIIYSLFIFIILLAAYAISRLIQNINKPGSKYFSSIDFPKPTREIIEKAVQGLLFSDKSKPYFVHGAPVNKEISQVCDKLDRSGFVWINGSPGDGKTMLAYHVLYAYHKGFGLKKRLSGVLFFWLKRRIYGLNINRISQESEIEKVFEELDSLKGGKRKMILVDDAHKLKFEEEWRNEFAEEAKERLNGKFIWISTNYLEKVKSDNSGYIHLDFEAFYPKLVSELYQTNNTVVNQILNKYTGLKEAEKLKHRGKIKDPWHFNFIASNGEHRIFELLEKLSDKKDEQDVLLLAIFLFSVRNIITGEKEINQTEFSNLLSKIDIPYFRKIIESYPPNKIISDIAAQEKGRFLIIENRNSLDRGFLLAPHYKMSINIINTITNRISDSVLIKQMIDASNLLLTNNFRETIYLGIYFNALGKYQGYFLSKKGEYIRRFLTEIETDHLQVYPAFLKLLNNYHPQFLDETLNDEYINIVAPKLTFTKSNKFTALGEFIRIFGNRKDKLLGKFEDSGWRDLSLEVCRSEVENLKQVADLIYVLRKDKCELIDDFQDADWVNFADRINRAEVTQFSQVADFVNSLGQDKERLIGKFTDQLWENFARKVIGADALHLKQVADFINALGENKEKLIGKFKDQEWGTLAKNIASHVEVPNFKQISNFLSALGKENEKLMSKLSDDDWISIAEKAKHAEVTQFSQLEAILNALGKYKEKIIGNFNDDDWEEFAKRINQSQIVQIQQVADFLNALGRDNEKILLSLDSEKIIDWSRVVDVKQIIPICIIISLMEEESRNDIIRKIDWSYMVHKIVIKHQEHVKWLSYVLYYNTKKQTLSNQAILTDNIREYLEVNKKDIVSFSTQFFKSPESFQILANLLSNFRVYSEDICLNISNNLKYIITTNFSITPRYYKSFSNLLGSIHGINPYVSNYIVTHPIFTEKFIDSVKDESFHHQMGGFLELCLTVMTVNQKVYDRIAATEEIRTLNLDSEDNIVP